MLRALAALVLLGGDAAAQQLYIAAAGAQIGFEQGLLLLARLLQLLLLGADALRLRVQLLLQIGAARRPLLLAQARAPVRQGGVQQALVLQSLLLARLLLRQLAQRQQGQALAVGQLQLGVDGGQGSPRFQCNK